MMSARDGSSSSSEDENTDRIKEAVWIFGAETHKMHQGTFKGAITNAQQPGLNQIH